MKNGSIRITKAEWYERGGFANSMCWRRDKGRGWEYYLIVE